MKRYRVTTFDFDSRAYFLEESIKPEWEQRVKENWIQNKNEITQGLMAEFGQVNYPMKINNFVEMGRKPFSIVAFHNRFFEQARVAFVMGAYYPALTGVCALGERILNHLVVRLRDYFKSSPEYKQVYGKDSFENWDRVLDILKGWSILRPDTIESFLKLKKLRNDNIHFDPSTDYHDRENALRAITEMTAIIGCQFAVAGTLPWFIPNTKGVTYIAKQWETNPFVKEIYLPNCELVGPRHRMEHRNGRLFAVDDEEYEDREITDEEFVALAERKTRATGDAP